MSEYKLSILGAIVAIVVVAGLLLALDKPVSTYIQIAAPTVVALLAVFRAEQNASNQKHMSHRLDRLVEDNQAFRKGLAALEDPQTTVHHAARIAVEEMPDVPPPISEDIK